MAKYFLREENRERLSTLCIKHRQSLDFDRRTLKKLTKPLSGQSFRQGTIDELFTVLHYTGDLGTMSYDDFVATYFFEEGKSGTLLQRSTNTDFGGESKHEYREDEPLPGEQHQHLNLHIENYNAPLSGKEVHVEQYRPTNVQTTFNITIEGEKTSPNENLTHIPPLNIQEDVVGITEESLESLFHNLHDSNRPVLVTGVIGIGKTTLARAFVNHFRDRYGYVIWLDYIVGLRESMTSNQDLCGELDLDLSISRYQPLRKSNLSERYDLLMKAIRKLPAIETKPNLLIIDNATDLADVGVHLKRFPANRWRTIITSTYKPRDSWFFRQYLVKPLKKGDAKQLFTRHCIRDVGDESDLDQLLEVIDNNPLVTVFLAKEANNNSKASVKHLLEIMRGAHAGHDDIGTRIESPHNVASSVVESFPYLLQVFDIDALVPLERLILIIMSVAPPVAMSDVHFSKALLEGQGSDPRLSSNQLVKLTQYWTTFRNAFRRKTNKHNHINICDALVDLHHSGRLEQTSEGFKVDEVIRVFAYHKFRKLKPMHRAMTCRYLSALGGYFHYHGNHAVSIEIMKRMIKEFKSIPSIYKVPLAKGGLFNNLASSYHDGGMYDKASEYMDQAIAFKEQARTEKPYLSFLLDLDLSYLNSVDIFLDAGEYDKAEKRLDKVELSLNKKRKSRRNAKDFSRYHALRARHFFLSKSDIQNAVEHVQLAISIESKYLGITKELGDFFADLSIYLAFVPEMNSEALNSMEQANSIYQKLFPDGHRKLHYMHNVLETIKGS